MDMNQFGSSHQSEEQTASLHSDFGPSMLQNQTQKKQTLPLISFKYHPGFFCFFEDYTNRKGWTFYECYDKVFQSHHQMMKIRRPIETILKDQNLDKTQKITELMHRAEKDKKFAYYLRRPDGQLQCNVITHEDRRIQQINKLKEQLAKLQKIKNKVVEQKKKEFQQKQIQRSKEQELQIQSILNQKERRANLIRRIQIEAEQKRIQRLQQKRLKQQKQNGSSSWIGQGSSKCQIM